MNLCKMKKRKNDINVILKNVFEINDYIYLHEKLLELDKLKRLLLNSN